MEFSTFSSFYILSFWVLLFIPVFFLSKAQVGNRQRIHYDAHFVLSLKKSRTLTFFILKATLLFVEQPVKLKFVDESLMNEPNAYMCRVTPVQDKCFLLFALKKPYRGLVLVTQRLSLNERIRMIVWILFFYDYVSVLYLVLYSRIMLYSYNDISQIIIGN